jgi:hypothetical protein
VPTSESHCEATDISVSAIDENSKLKLSYALQGLFFKVYIRQLVMVLLFL